MKVKTPKNSPIEVLYTAAKEIVDGTRRVFAEQGHDGREIRLPILMHGTDMRVTIEAGPRIAARNVIEHAQMEATGRPTPQVNMGVALDKARELIGLLHSTQSDDAIRQRCIDAIKDLNELERLV